LIPAVSAPTRLRGLVNLDSFGALVGSLTMAYFSRNPHKAKIQAYTGTLLGIALALFGLCSAVRFSPGALVTLFCVGLCLDFDSTINNTLILLNADRAYYGWVMSVYMMTFSLAPLGGFLSGWSIDHVGGAATMLAAGGLLSLFVIGMANFHPGYRKIRDTPT
jgi:hypothetical protein